MNELTVRNLTPRELAEELRYSDDLATRTLALHIIEYEIDETRSVDVIAGLEDDLSTAEGDAEEAQRECEDLKDLLRECSVELVGIESAEDLILRIKAAT